MNAKHPLVLIGGPTGSGKSEVAGILAEILPVEIVNADSRQFFRETVIGTDSPPPDVLAAIPHHCIGFLSITETFTVNDFILLLERLIPSVWRRKSVPLVVGGSGLYFRVLRKGLFALPDTMKAGQEEARNILEQCPTPALYAELSSSDPETAAKLHPHDRVRIRRALEVWRITGKPMSAWQKEASPPSFMRKARTRCFVITRRRDILHGKIGERVERMFKAGWVEEVRKLSDAGLAQALRKRAPIGYPEILDHIEGKTEYADTVERVKQATREYARKQTTWFRKEPDCRWLDLSEISPEQAAKIIAGDIPEQEKG